MKQISYLETQLNYLEAHAADLERKVARLASLLEEKRLASLLEEKTKKKAAALGQGAPPTASAGQSVRPY